MHPRTLLVLFFLVAALAAFIWFVERDLPGSDERVEQAKRVLDVDAAEVSRLSVTSGGRRIVLAIDRQDEGAEWELVEPSSARADTSVVEQVVDALTGLEKERTLEGGDPAQLGLEPPRGEVEISSGDETWRLLLGGEVPASESMIVAAGESGPFHVVAGSVWEEVDREPDDWRSRDVFPGDREEIERVLLEHEGRRLVLARRGEEFFVEAPLVDRADEGTVSRFLDALVGLEVEEFLGVGDEAAGIHGLSPASAGVEVVRREGSTWRLELGAVTAVDEDETPQIFARAEGHLYAIGDTLREDLERPAEEWRSLDWGRRQAFEMDRLEVRDAAGTMVLERDGGEWTRDGEGVDYSTVSDLLYAISGTKAEALDADDAVSGEALLSIVVNPGDEEQILDVYQPAGDSYPATASDRDVAVWLGGDRIRALQSSLAAVRAAEVVEEELSEVPADSPSGADEGS